MRTSERAGPAFNLLLLAFGVSTAALLAFRSVQLGDYPRDAGPALSALARGQLGAFFAHQPAMGAVSLYVRAPFVVLAARLNGSQLTMFRWGSVPCVVSVALVAVWCARIAGRRAVGRVGQVAIVAIALLNPLASNALLYGHPEELLTGSLAVGALLAAAEQRVVLTAVLAGLAVASKQWALLVLCPCLLTLERDRLRAALVTLSTAAAATLPMLVANLGSFTHTLHYISRPQSPTTMFSWLYPLSPNGSGHVAMIFGPTRPFFGHVNVGIESALSHPLIICIGILVPLVVWRANGRTLAPRDAFLTTALVLLLRCTLDPGAWPYYYGAVVLVLLAFDAYADRALPLAGLAAALTSFVVLDRLPSYLPESQGNLICIAATAIGALLLIRGLRQRTDERRYPASAASIA